jgi:hypothetical protein
MGHQSKQSMAVASFQEESICSAREEANEALGGLAPTRRAMLGFGTAAAAAAVATPADLEATAPPDAAITALCNRLVAIEHEAATLDVQTRTIADERRAEQEMIAINGRRDAVVAELERLGPPKTMAGIQAVARASLATHIHKDNDGVVVPICPGHRMALIVCECLGDP